MFVSPPVESITCNMKNMCISSVSLRISPPLVPRMPDPPVVAHLDLYCLDEFLPSERKYDIHPRFLDLLSIPLNLFFSYRWIGGSTVHPNNLAFIQFVFVAI